MVSTNSFDAIYAFIQRKRFLTKTTLISGKNENWLPNVVYMHTGSAAVAFDNCNHTTTFSLFWHSTLKKYERLRGLVVFHRERTTLNSEMAIVTWAQRPKKLDCYLPQKRLLRSHG